MGLKSAPFFEVIVKKPYFTDLLKNRLHVCYSLKGFLEKFKSISIKNQNLKKSGAYRLGFLWGHLWGLSRRRSRK